MQRQYNIYQCNRCALLKVVFPSPGGDSLTGVNFVCKKDGSILDNKTHDLGNAAPICDDIERGRPEYTCEKHDVPQWVEVKE